MLYLKRIFFLGKDMKYEEVKRILQKAHDGRKLVFFVGAGCSAASGLPQWGALVREIANRMEGDFDRDDYLKVPQYYYNARGEKEYNELIFEFLDYKNKLPNSIHEKIICLGASTIITTNYDDLVEKEAANQGYFFDIVSKDKDLPYCKSDKQIIKMHGDFSNKNFVLREDDYLNYDVNFKLIKTQIQSLFAKNVVVFIGFSYNDFNVKMIFEWVRNILGNDFQRAYLLQIDGLVNPLVEEYFRHRGINIIYANDLPIIKTDESEREVRTRRALDYLFDKSNNKDILETIYPKLEILDVFNSVHHKQLLQALKYKGNATSSIEGNRITFVDTNLAKALFDKINSTEKNKRLLTSVFGKANIQFLNFQMINETHEFPVEKNEEADVDMIEIIKYPDYQKRNDHIKRLSREASIQNNIKKAYIYYLLDEHVLAYNELIIASKEALAKGQLIWFYISEYNRYYLSRNFLFDYQQKEGKKISVDIDLDKTLDKIVSSDSYYRTALKDINNWSVFNNSIRDADAIRRKTAKEANTVYCMYGGTLQ